MLPNKSQIYTDGSKLENIMANAFIAIFHITAIFKNSKNPNQQQYFNLNLKQL